jgi:TolA-binding protein
MGCAGDQQLKKQVADLQAQVTELQASIADMNLRMEELNSSLFVLRETVRNNREALKKIQEEAKAPTVYIEQPPEPVIQTPPFQPLPKVAEADKALPPLPLPAGTGTPSGNDQVAFQAAMKQVEKQNWGLAVYDLNAFVAQHPGSAYVPKARYALGEAYRNLSEHAQAVREYERCLAAGETAGPYAARALYWLIEGYQVVGQPEKSKQARQRLLQEYPNSPEAKKLNLESPR